MQGFFSKFKAYFRAGTILSLTLITPLGFVLAQNGALGPANHGLNQELREMRKADPSSCNGLLGLIAGFQTQALKGASTQERIMAIATASKRIFMERGDAFQKFGSQRVRHAAQSLSVHYLADFGTTPLLPSDDVLSRFRNERNARRTTWVATQRSDRFRLPRYSADSNSLQSFEREANAPPSLTLMIAPQAIQQVRINGEEKIFRPLDREATGIDASDSELLEQLDHKIWTLDLMRKVQDRFFKDADILPRSEMAVVDGTIGLLIDPIDFKSKDDEIDFDRVSADEINRMVAFQFLLGATDLQNGKNLMLTHEGRLVNYDPTQSFDFTFNFVDENPNRMFGSQMPAEYPEGFETILKKIVREIKAGEHHDLPDFVRYRLLFASELMLQDMTTRTQSTFNP